MTIAPHQRKLNWRRQLPDFRDHRVTEMEDRTGTHLAIGPHYVPPPSVDLRPKFPPAIDQGQLGSCVWNATAGAVQFCMKSEGSKAFKALPSRLFGYYNTRVMENSVSQDNGCVIRDAMKALNAQGICSEIEWPYIENQFAVQPTKICYRDATQEESVHYALVDNTQPDQVKAVLGLGYPIIFGISVYDSFLSSAVAKSGAVPMPGATETVQGGHAMLLVGYDDPTGVYRFRNSWGPDWGQNGFGTIPQDYISSPYLCGDCWVLTFVTK